MEKIELQNDVVMLEAFNVLKNEMMSLLEKTKIDPSSVTLEEAFGLSHSIRTTFPMEKYFSDMSKQTSTSGDVQVQLQYANNFQEFLYIAALHQKYIFKKQQRQLEVLEKIAMEMLLK